MGLSPFFIDGAVSQMQMNGLNIVRAVSKLLGYRRWRPSWLIHLLILFSFDLHFPCLLFGQIVLLHYFIGPLISFFFACDILIMFLYYLWISFFLIHQVFSYYPAHRQLIIDDIMTSLTKLPTSRRGLKNYRWDELLSIIVNTSIHTYIDRYSYR